MTVFALRPIASSSVPQNSVIPEPGSIILPGSAVAGIGYITWERRRK
jgi:hypothetical protein